ncbi:unnamed protein product, partial [Amoebophrya sp. A120]
ELARANGLADQEPGLSLHQLAARLGNAAPPEAVFEKTRQEVRKNLRMLERGEGPTSAFSAATEDEQQGSEIQREGTNTATKADAFLTTAELTGMIHTTQRNLRIHRPNCLACAV